MPENCFLKLFVPFSKWGQFWSRKKVFVDDTKVFPKLFQCYGFFSSSLTSPDVDQTWDIFCVIECHCNVEIACHFSKFVAERWLENMQTHFFRWLFCHSRIFLPLVYRLSYGLFVGKTNRLCGKATPYRNELLKNSLQKSCFQTTQGQF